MDILDIMLARAMTPQGKTEAYVAKANAAAAKAEKAEQDAAAAIQTVEDAATEIATAKSEAADLLATAQETLETAQEAQINTLSTEDVDDEISKLGFELNQTSSSTYNGRGYKVLYPDNATPSAMPDVVKLYKSTGSNEDGSMTQKAITDALNDKASTSVLNNYATKTYVDQKIVSGGGGISNLGSNNAGKIVVVGQDGNITPGSITEEEITSSAIEPIDSNTIGLAINYDEKSCSKIGNITNFNSYAMYGGRMRCNVADNGTINAFYGDTGYIEDGSNGQVMVYQPKFYYQRIIVEETSDEQGRVINKEQLLLSPVEKTGFKIHPLFVRNGEILDYVLLPAYEGCVYDTSAQSYINNNGTDIDLNADKLSSIAGVVPLSGENKTLLINDLRKLAQNRGAGWELTDIYFESALQMLAITESSLMNCQEAIGKGIINASGLGSGITGSTSSLGNTTGRAARTTFSKGQTSTDEDKTAITYRGMENPWGNLWRFVDKITIRGAGNTHGGVVYINDTSYDVQLPNVGYGWISNMGLGNNTEDWLFIPIKGNSSANSAVPVGDALWATSNLNDINKVNIGGSSIGSEGCGLFNYGCDIAATLQINQTNARPMFIPTKNSIYNANITKWQAKYGG